MGGGVMDKTHQTAVVLSPPEDSWGAIQVIRQKHDRNFRRWMPHVTLLYPFLPKAQFETWADVFGAACRSVAPFEVTLATFRYFEHGRGRFAAWLAPEPADALDALQAALWAVCPACDEVRAFRNGFTPHLSVGQTQTDPVGLIAELQRDLSPLVFRAGRVDLIWRNESPDDVFRVGYSVALGTGTIQRVKA